MNEIRDLIVGIDFGKEYSQNPDLFFYLIKDEDNIVGYRDFFRSVNPARSADCFLQGKAFADFIDGFIGENGVIFMAETIKKFGSVGKCQTSPDQRFFLWHSINLNVWILSILYSVMTRA